MDSGLTIILLGNSGVGKSASGNTILGRPAFVSKRSFKSVTKEIYEESGNVFGKQMTVIDTPGILCAGVENSIRSRCDDISRSGRPHLFLVVTKIDRFTAEQHEALDAAIRIIGDRGMENSYLLFTGGDLLETSLDSFIFEDDESSLPDVVERFRGRFHSFNNEDGGQEQVRDLLLKSGQLNVPAILPLEPDHPEVRRILLLGRPGAGRSLTGNTILGSDRFTVGRGFQPVTLRCSSASGEVEGRTVTVVDTPGFSDEVLTQEQLYLEIMQTIIEAAPGPHAFVVVVKFDRITETDKKLLELLPILFGPDASRYTMVIFTHGDELRNDLRGRSVDQMIWSNRSVADLVSMCAGRYCVFDNTQTGRRQQVRNLLGKIDELVTANGGTHYTSDMFKMAYNLIKEAQRQAAQSHGTNEARKLSGGIMQLLFQWKFKKDSIRCFFAACFPCLRQRHSSGSDNEPLLSEDEDSQRAGNERNPGLRRRQAEAMQLDNLLHDD